MSAVQERLLSIRNARERCHMIAASLQANLRRITPGLDASCKALRQHAELVAIDEFELLLPAPRSVQVGRQQSYDG